MARQDGLFKFTGTINGISFYYDKRTGYQARTRGGVDGKVVKTDPRFERTRENSAEFACAARSAKALRMALHEMLDRCTDGTLVNRLNSRMLRVIKSASQGNRGQRTIMQGDSALLKGFELNANAAFGQVLGVAAGVVLSDDGLHITITFNAPVKPELISAPADATHVRVSSIVAGVNFETLTWRTFAPDVPSAPVPLRALPVSLGPRTHTLAARDATHLIVVLNVEFCREANGTLTCLNDKGCHAGVVAEVFRVRE